MKFDVQADPEEVSNVPTEQSVRAGKCVREPETPIRCLLYTSWPRSVSSIPDLEKFMNEADYTLLYVTDREKWDQMIREQNNRLMYLDYSDGNYIVTHPTTIAEIFQEGISQNNCLLSMFEEIAPVSYTHLLSYCKYI